MMYTPSYSTGIEDLDGKRGDDLHLSLQGTAVWYLRRRDCEVFRQLKAPPKPLPTRAKIKYKGPLMAVRKS
jgi:hypothetical protein